MDLQNSDFQNVEVMYSKFDKAKAKENYKLLDVQQSGRFRISLFQVDLPEPERVVLNQRLARKAFANLTN